MIIHQNLDDFSKINHDFSNFGRLREAFNPPGLRAHFGYGLGGHGSFGFASAERPHPNITLICICIYKVYILCIYVCIIV